MIVRDITEKDRKDFNSIVTHPLQSFEWGEFRIKTGIKVIRRGFFDSKGEIIDAFQLTIHKIPKTPFNIGYLPKGNLPTKEVLAELTKIGKQEKCVFIQLEPQVEVNHGEIENLEIRPSAHPMFSKYTFQFDLTKTEDEMLKNMHPKTRYNIKVAQKHNVKIIEDNTDKAFEEYIKLTQETTKRQGFYAHTERYHRLMWDALKNQRLENKMENLNELTAHLFLAKYKFEILVAWIVFIFKDAIYYPYGASSREHRETMAATLMMWHTIKFGKTMKLKIYDMWGSLGENPDPKDPWFGFHRFKQGFNPRLVEFVGSYDLVINPHLYEFYKVADKIRWTLLRFKR